MEKEEYKGEALKSFLFKTQITRKVDFTQYLFTFKNCIAFLISLYLLINYGEDLFIPTAIAFLVYLYLGYKKEKSLFDFKINKRNTNHFYYLFGKIKKEVVKNKNFNQTELLFSDLFLNGTKVAKKNKKKGKK